MAWKCALQLRVQQGSQHHAFALSPCEPWALPCSPSRRLPRWACRAAPLTAAWCVARR